MDPRGHTPVLLDAVLESLAIKPDGVYVDGTFGRGGHSGAILERLSEAGSLLAIDKDPQAVAVAEHEHGNDARFSIERGAFTMLESVVESRQLLGKVNGILLDLGVSSPQLDDPDRGFSFSQDGPLDMRMDPASEPSAAEWLATVSETELARVLHELGEERFSRRVARAILAARATTAIDTTAKLAEIVSSAVPTREKGKHPATRTFQAIRIHINKELEQVAECLQQCPAVLAPGGRLVVISFHSLEDRIVKRFIREQEKPTDNLPAKLPVRTEPVKPVMRKLGKPVTPGAEEIAANPRARSAVLRVAEKCA